jgi:hypothetical protein
MSQYLGGFHLDKLEVLFRNAEGFEVIEGPWHKNDGKVDDPYCVGVWYCNRPGQADFPRRPLLLPESFAKIICAAIEIGDAFAQQQGLRGENHV